MSLLRLNLCLLPLLLEGKKLRLPCFYYICKLITFLGQLRNCLAFFGQLRFKSRYVLLQLTKAALLAFKLLFNCAFA